MYCLDPTTNTEQQRFRLRFQNDAKNSSFSSTLLDQIYRSIDHTNNETMPNKHNTRLLLQQDLTPASIPRAKVGTQRGHLKIQTEAKSRSHHHHEHDQEIMFFSSTSSSSDSSSGILSSSDTESLYGARSKSRVSCFAPSSRPKPVVTSASSNEEGLIKSKSRALKIYNKVKQPISPGGKLSNFLNSLLFAKTKTYDDTKPASSSNKSGQDSTCSSASSFSRSCLSKATPSTSSSNNKMRDNRVKRTVRFYPVSVIVDEDSRPCGHKCLYEEDTRVKAVDRSRRVEEAAREFLKEYHRSHKKNNDLNCLKDFPTNVNPEDDDDEDAASCSSSDLFELDHLAVLGNNRYREELPVYETTHVVTNRAIANGLI